MSQEFATGLTMSLIFTSAVVASWLVRHVLLALAAGTLLLAFTHGDGIIGLMAVSQLTAMQFKLHPEFARGATIGACAAIVFGWALWSRRK